MRSPARNAYRVEWEVIVLRGNKKVSLCEKGLCYLRFEGCNF